MNSQIKTQALSIVFSISLAVLLTACRHEEAPSAMTSSPPDFKLHISPDQAKIQPGDQNQFTVAMTSPEGTTNNDISLEWSLSDTNVATVDTKSGIVTAIKEGTAKMTVCKSGRGCVTALVEVSQSARPMEITDIYPYEDQYLSRTDPFFIGFDCDDKKSACPSTPIIPPLVYADFIFPWPDRLKSERMIIDSVKVATDVRVEVNVLDHPVLKTRISYPVQDFSSGRPALSLLDVLALGVHMVTVEATSEAGKIATYTWSFTLKE